MKEKENYLTDYETFADRLERLLVERKMQKAELAERIGFSANGISTWKATGTIPRADIAVIFGTYEGIDTKKDSLAYKIAKLPENKKRLLKRFITLYHRKRLIKSVIEIDKSGIPPPKVSPIPISFIA